MRYQIRLVKLKSIKTGKEWYKDKVGNYYAVYGSPFEDNDPYFGGEYIVYSGIGSTTSCRISRFNLEVLTDEFCSDQLEEKQKELGIDIKHDYASEKVFVLSVCATHEVLGNRGVFKSYFAAQQYLETEEDLKGEVYIQELELIG